MTTVHQQARDVRPGPPPTAAPIVAPTDTPARARARLLCAACSHAITDQTAAISVQGAHDHHFVNPHGHAFHVGIFNHAPGSLPVGPLVNFYSWFPGLPWRLAVCNQCNAHLGWSYGAITEFFALILDRLRPAADEH